MHDALRVLLHIERTIRLVFRQANIRRNLLEKEQPVDDEFERSLGATNDIVVRYRRSISKKNRLCQRQTYEWEQEKGHICGAKMGAVPLVILPGRRFLDEITIIVAETALFDDRLTVFREFFASMPEKRIGNLLKQIPAVGK